MNSGSESTTVKPGYESLIDTGRIAVLMGGSSSEREVSLESGDLVVNSLLEAGFDAVAIDTCEDTIGKILQLAPGFCFIALHGGEGENGTIQALLDMLGIPYTGSGVLGSALAMDKLRSKQVWQSLGLPTPDYAVVNDNSEADFAAILKKLGGSVFVKPVSEGSSFGMGRAERPDSLRDAISLAQRYQKEVLIEQRINGSEYTVAILQGQVLPSIRIQTDRDFYDYEAKYRDDQTRFMIPSGLNEEEESELQHLSRQAFDALGCRDWGRVDVMRCGNTGRFYLLEVNTVPGLTSHSLVPMAAKASGKSLGELLVDIVRLGMERK